MKKFRKAILLIHGFAGGVYDFEYLTHQLELISNYDVYTFTLPGHDGDLNEKITNEDWLRKVDKEMTFLIDNGYKNIYVFGHSMGGVLASYVASKYKEVKRLVLASPAFMIYGYENGTVNLKEAIKAPSKIIDQYGIKLVTNRLLKLPANCYVEFFKLINSKQDCIRNLNVPTLVLWGNSDTIVPKESANYAIDSISSKYKKMVVLNRITHDIFRENKKDQATKLIIKFFRDKRSVIYFKNLINEKDS